MKHFEEPILNIQLITVEDVITTSSIEPLSQIDDLGEWN